MRISDWSSDVCSSDLRFAAAFARNSSPYRRCTRQRIARKRARRGTKSAIPFSKDFDLMALAEPFAVDHPFMPPDTFTDDVILVTGGGTGLGKAMAQMFARHGGRIAIASRKEEHRAAGVAAIEALGGPAIGEIGRAHA